jgi:hypothetical protein
MFDKIHSISGAYDEKNDGAHQFWEVETIDGRELTGVLKHKVMNKLWSMHYI